MSPHAEALRERLNPLGEILGELVARQERLEAELAELREAAKPPRVMRAKDFVDWYRRELGFEEGRYPIAYDTVIRWWDERKTNGAEAWGRQKCKGATLWVDANALLRWRATR